MSTTAAALLRWARRQANLTQAELAERLGTTQAAVARLERTGSNPTLGTLREALRAADHRLELGAAPWKRNVDESLVATQLRMTPEQRLASFEGTYQEAREIALAGARSRGEVP